MKILDEWRRGGSVFRPGLDFFYKVSIHAASREKGPEFAAGLLI